MINTHNGVKEKGTKPINIEDYPAVKKHLDLFYPQLEKRADKGDTPYNLRNCAYIEDFYKQKIIYPDIMRMPSKKELLHEYPYIYFDENTYFAEATNFIMTGKNIDIIFSFLVSDVGFFTFTKFYSGPQFDATGFRYKKAYLEEVFIPIINKDNEEILNNELNGSSFERTDNINNIWMNIMGFNEDETDLILNYKKLLLNN